jgi:hypothetical protein
LVFDSIHNKTQTLDLPVLATMENQETKRLFSNPKPAQKPALRLGRLPLNSLIKLVDFLISVLASLLEIRLGLLLELLDAGFAFAHLLGDLVVEFFAFGFGLGDLFQSSVSREGRKEGGNRSGKGENSQQSLAVSQLLLPTPRRLSWLLWRGRGARS